MNPIQSIAEQYIQRNRTRFLDQYYNMSSNGGIVLYFNEDCTLKTEQFMDRITILQCSDLPRNAYSESKKYWTNYPQHLVFISCFWPVKHNVPFSVYALSIFPDELVKAQNILQALDPDSLSSFDMALRTFELCSNVIANNPNLAEAYLTRASCIQILLQIGLRRGDQYMSRVAAIVSEEKGSGLIQDLLKAESLGSYQATYLMENDPLLRTLKKSKQSSKSRNYTPTSDTSSSQDSCFIATVAYGTSKHPDLDILRQFRDTKLSKNLIGRSFIKFYYDVGPSLARSIKQVPFVRSILKICISFLCRFLVRFSF